MKEIAITTGKKMHEVGMSIDIWKWEVPVYLFLGGLTAGLMLFAAYMILKDKGKEFPFATNKAMLLVPITMSLGMQALFLDLTHKLFVWRFYTAFNITSVMSWGSWILLLVYPFSIILALATLKEGWPSLYKLAEKIIPFKDLFNKVIDLSVKYRKPIAAMSIPVAILLGIYTGVLLSAFGARPFWGSAILGPLFLVSGASTGAALLVIMAKEKKEKEFFTKVDLGLIATELVILILFIIGLATSTTVHQEALKLIMGGQFTLQFWIFVVSFGLVIPASLEWMELKGIHLPGALAATLVLVGGLILRFVMVDAGQVSSWLPY